MHRAWDAVPDRWLNVSLVVRQSAGASLRRVAGPHMDLLPSGTDARRQGRKPGKC